MTLHPWRWPPQIIEKHGLRLHLYADDSHDPVARHRVQQCFQCPELQTLISVWPTECAQLASAAELIEDWDSLVCLKSSPSSVITDCTTGGHWSRGVICRIVPDLGILLDGDVSMKSHEVTCCELYQTTYSFIVLSLLQSSPYTSPCRWT